jgi:Mrp family chromosome partitioning ATPase/capsular polysaccharide biosynthesis protein
VDLDQTIAAAAATLRVRETDAAGIVEVMCESPDPRISADFANALVEAYVDQDLEEQFVGAATDRKGVAEQLDKLAIQIRQRAAQLKVYALESVVRSDARDSVAAEKLTQLRNEVAKVKRLRDQRETGYAVASSLPQEALGALPEGQKLRQLESNLTELKSQRARLAQDFLPKHPSMVELDRQIGVVQEALAKGRADVVKRTEVEYLAIAQKQNVLEDAYAKQLEDVTQNLGFSAEHQQLRQEFEQDLNAYENLLKDAGLNTVISAIRSPKLRVIDSAIPPLRPREPVALRETGNGAISGLFLTVFYILTSAHFTRTLRRSGDVARLVGTPELAAIPRPEYGRTSRGILNRLSLRKSVPLLENEWVEETRRTNGYLECAERILSRHADGSVVAILSPTRRGGKLAVTANLGIALAELGKRVLLIDADARPGLHEYFGVPQGPALPGVQHVTDVLRIASGRPISPYLRELRQNLFLFSLPATEESGGGTRLLRSQAHFRSLVEQCRQEFDLILMEAPAVFANGSISLQAPDARIAVREADSAILVLRSGETSALMARQALSQLVRDKANVLGAILVDCPRVSAANDPYTQEAA